jgi:hypothetical protein
VGITWSKSGNKKFQNSSKNTSNSRPNMKTTTCQQQPNYKKNQIAGKPVKRINVRHN